MVREGDTRRPEAVKRMPQDALKSAATVHGDGWLARFINSRSLRLRFLLVTLARLVARRMTKSHLRNSALALAEAGHARLAQWCVHRLDLNDGKGILDALLAIYFRTGNFDAAWWLLMDAQREYGMRPHLLLWFTGEALLANNPRAAAAHGILDEEIIRQWPSPYEGELPGLSEMQSRIERGSDARETFLLLARLCFSFTVFSVAARLFERAGSLAAHDEIARHYAALRAGEDVQAVPAYLFNALQESNASAHWYFFLATVAFCAGHEALARKCIAANLAIRFDGHADLAAIQADCDTIVRLLLRSGDVLRLPSSTVDPHGDRQEGLPKIFICGFGWSGSGALYDALKEYDLFTEFPAAPAEDYLDEDTVSEMTLVQAAHGLGNLWVTRRRGEPLEPLAYWDLFRCHVAAGAFAGYVEYKSVHAAAHLVNVFGSRYTGVFRNFLERLVRQASLLEALREATERLCTMVHEREPGKYVLFNNAVFGRNLEMLEIFSNVKAAAVYRDPRDVYADRKTKDRNHWRSVRQFARFYEKGLAKYFRYCEAHAAACMDVRGVSFERFVLDAAYRDDVLDWLMDGERGNQVTRRFFPEESSRNVGQYRRLLSAQEKRFLEHAGGAIRHVIAAGEQAERFAARC